MTVQHIATAFGYAGVLANILWPIMRSRNRMLLGQGLACLLMLAHFSLLGAFSGAAVMMVAGIQAILAIPLGAHKRFRLTYLGSLLFTPVVCIATWHGPESLFSSIAMAVFSIANYQLDPVRQRALLIVVVLAWYFHNFMVWSVPGLVSNTLALLVSVRMLFIVCKGTDEAKEKTGKAQSGGT